MYLSGNFKTALNRQIFLRSSTQEISRLVSPGILRPKARKRRFSTHSEHPWDVGSAGSPASSKFHQEDRGQLENFTRNALRTQRLPLGTLSQEDWDEIVTSICTWATETTAGRDIDSAQKLLQRLHYELIVGSPRLPEYGLRNTQLAQLRQAIFDSWLQVHEQNLSSGMALERAQEVILDSVDGESLIFPGPQLLALLDAWERHQSPPGSPRAAELLLLSTDDANLENMSHFSNDLAPRFDRTLFSLLCRKDAPEHYTLISRLLERLDFFRNQDSWEGAELSDATLEALERFSLETSDYEEENATNNNAAVESQQAPPLSSFEAEAMQKRLVELLSEASAEDSKKVSKMIHRMKLLDDPSEELLVALVDYFLRIGDAQNASIWTLHLRPQTVLSPDSETTMSIIDKLLDCWLQEKKPRAPWRAEEVFREVLNQCTAEDKLTLSTMNRILQIWSQSSDPAAKRKVMEWFQRMTHTMALPLDATTLGIVLKASEGNLRNTPELYDDVLEQWGGWDRDERQYVAEGFLQSLWKANELPSTALSLLALIEKENLNVSEKRYLPLLHRAFFDINSAAIPEAVEKLVIENQLESMVFYEAAIFSLIKRNENAFDVAEEVWRRALKMASQSETIMASDLLSSFMTRVMRMYVSKNSKRLYVQGERLLQEAEKIFFSIDKKTSEKRTESVIPLEIYKLLIVRNWYRPETAKYIIELCERVKSLYSDGYRNLRPDQDLFLGYLKATSVLSKEVDDLNKILDEMTNLYELTQDLSCRPNADAFNVILLAIKNNKTATASSACKSSLELWNKMMSLKVTPDTKTVNFVMQSVIKDSESKNVYSGVLRLFKKLEQFKVEPDLHTHHHVIVACGQAKPEDREAALELCLKAFGEIRKQKAATVFTYASLTKSLRRLLPGGPKPVADRIATSTLKMCCRDGLLAPDVRNAFESLITSGVWTQNYELQLTEDNQEPEEWHCNLPKPN